MWIDGNLSMAIHCYTNLKSISNQLELCIAMDAATLKIRLRLI